MTLDSIVAHAPASAIALSNPGRSFRVVKLLPMNSIRTVLLGMKSHFQLKLALVARGDPRAISAVESYVL